MNLAAIRERAERATPGPWTRTKPERDEIGFIQGVAIAATLGRQTIYANPPGGQFPSDDADFIAHSRQDIPDLLKLVEEAREILESLGAFMPDILELSKVNAWLKMTDGE